MVLQEMRCEGGSRVEDMHAEKVWIREKIKKQETGVILKNKLYKGRVTHHANSSSFTDEPESQ